MTIMTALFTRHTYLVGLWVIACLLSAMPSAKACISPDTLPTVTLNYDPTFTECEIRVSNLRLMTEAPNKFCTCAVSSYSTIFTNLLYVAFVDSGTNNPYANFAPWDANASASTSWDASTAGGGYPDWSGFVAEVINTGLSPTNAVELIIRAELPPGYTVSFLDSTLSSTFLGTDEWDPVGDSVKAAHQGLASFGQVSNALVEKPMSYFSAIDSTVDAYYDSLATNLKSFDGSVFGLSVGPNPAHSEVTLQVSGEWARETLEVELVDASGRSIWLTPEFLDPVGIATRRLRIRHLPQTPGLYVIRVHGQHAIRQEKLVIQ